jgi:hypothetical protein
MLPPKLALPKIINERNRSRYGVAEIKQPTTWLNQLSYFQ